MAKVFNQDKRIKNASKILIGAAFLMSNWHNGFSRFFNNISAQFAVYASESTYPSDITELEQIRVVSEHTVQTFFSFIGSAQVSKRNTLC